MQIRIIDTTYIKLILYFMVPIFRLNVLFTPSTVKVIFVQFIFKYLVLILMSVMVLTKLVVFSFVNTEFRFISQITSPTFETKSVLVIDK